MKTINYKISLDCHKNGNQYTISVKKNDTASRSLIISLVDNGKPYEIEEGCYATFRGLKPDGTVLFNACTINENNINYTITVQTISAVGEVKCEITLYDGNGSQLASPCFIIIVEDILYDDSEIESTNEYSALNQDLARSEAVENISFQNSGTHIQWKHESDTQWNDIVALSEITGEQGIQGVQGVKGDNAVWIFGTQITSSGTYAVSGSKAGDIYLNTSTMNVYYASSANVWVYACNIKGATGETGATGAQGINAQWITGTVITDSGTYLISGVHAGDIYLNTTTYNLYKADTATTWTYLCNIKGVKGDTGAQGPSVTVDTAVSAASFNAVGNNAVYNALYSLESKLTEKTSYGVIRGLLVWEQSTPNMTVQVTSGVVYMPPITTGAVSARFAPSAINAMAINAADAVNPRKDIVYISSSGVITYLAGTAAANPVQPSTPSNGLLLAVISVPAGTTLITRDMVIDSRMKLGAEPWLYPTLINAWEPYELNPASAVKYYKDITGRVHLQGLIKTGAAGSIAFYLSAGYAPPAGGAGGTYYFTTRSATPAIISGSITTSGGVIPTSQTYTGYILLNGISFRAGD